MTNARILLMRHAEKTEDSMESAPLAGWHATGAKLVDFISAAFLDDGRPEITTLTEPF